MNFALILLILVVLTGIAWVLDKLVFLPQRRRAADAAVAEFDRQQERVGERFADENAPQTRARLHDDKLRQPWWLEYTASFFPVILAGVFPALVPVRAVQDPVELDGPDPAGGRPDPGLGRGDF